MAVNDRTTSSKQLAARWSIATGVLMSVSSTSAASWIVCKGTFIQDPPHGKQSWLHLQWAHEHRAEQADCHQVVLSDKSCFNLWGHDGNIRVRRYAGERCLPECVNRWHSGLTPEDMVWDAIPYHRRYICPKLRAPCIVCIPLTENHIKDNLAWCRKHLSGAGDDWGGFSSVTNCDCLDSYSKSVSFWSRYQPSNTVEKGHYGRGGLGRHHGRQAGILTFMSLIRGMTGQGYLDKILAPYVNFFRGAHETNFIFMNDNAWPQSSVGRRILPIEG
ncbi:transposable element Tcb2 transposase [Trichonephila clavipes]|nr:transposable element Tcb2 transposase [Trichonephila clavipes]